MPSNGNPRRGAVFGSAFDLWMPAFYLTAVIVFVGFLFDAALGALATVAVFFLGVIPTAKMKRADLLATLQERFNAQNSDMEALGAFESDSKKVNAPIAARAFYLKFWNLQILEFGLWRYGMLPSDTYAHWIVRRLLSFRDTNPERYWGSSPRDGWSEVKDEFAGTDFRQFMEAANKILEDVEDQMKKDGSDDAKRRYNELHERVERLLVAASGRGIMSTFVFRWFAAYRKPLKGQTPEHWAAKTKTPLWRENPALLRIFVAIPILLTAAAFYFGFRLHSKKAAHDATVVLGPAPAATIVIDSQYTSGSVFVVRFPEEGSCTPGGEPRRWRGALLSTSSSSFVSGIGRALAACRSQRHPVSVEVAGFASSADFTNLRNCGGTNNTTAAANLDLANARAANVADVLQRSLTDAVKLITWENAAKMESERGFVDRALDGSYNTDRGSLNRRVEIRVLDAGECAVK